MKLPRLDAAAASDFAIHHGEKIVVAIVGLGAAALAWGAVTSLRSLSVTEAQTPDAVERVATQARGHIDREPQPPADLLPPRTPLADSIDPWRTPLVPWKSGSMPGLNVAPPPVFALLDNPLFEEAAKRDKPDVFPIEDLRAVAGLAVLPAAVPKADQAGPPRPVAPPGPEDGEGGKIVPFVIVTGMIPVAKQQAEYRRRFEACGYRDQRRDSPLWCDFEIDRGTIGPDGRETWEPINLADVAARQLRDGLDAAAVGVPAEFLLAAGEDARSRQTTPIGFCSPLPRRIDGSWELADLHPWVIARLEEQFMNAARQQDGRPGDQADAGAGREGPEFVVPEEPTTEPMAAPDVLATLPDRRLFRFVDTQVQPGATYRYRVRLKVWNPNYDRNPERMRPHLTDPTLARDPKLPAAASEPSPAAAVPDMTRILVGTLRRAEIKDLRLKPGTLEVLVLAPSVKRGAFALRALIADPGAVIDVDEKLNLRNQRDRARGESIATGRILVDARGRQEDRADGPSEKEKAPDAIPEPFDVICARPDGSFELASVADSERSIEAYRSTLPSRGTKAEATKEPVPGEGPRIEAPFDPLARPGAVR